MLGTTLLEDYILDCLDDQNEVTIQSADCGVPHSAVFLSIRSADTADYFAKCRDIIIYPIAVHRGCHFDNLWEEPLHGTGRSLTNRTGTDRIGVHAQRADACMNALDDAVVFGHLAKSRRRRGVNRLTTLCYCRNQLLGSGCAIFFQYSWNLKPL